MNIEKIIEVADSHIEDILKKGYANAGCNGPYRNKVTPVRNSAHWLVTYAILFENTNNSKYKDVANVLIDYLLNKAIYGKNKVIKVINDDKFGYGNGLIGQAWVIEALVVAYKIFNSKDCLSRAEELFYAQKFNEERGLWEFIDSDGINKGCWIAYNQQLWFSAVGSMVYDCNKDENINANIIRFLDCQNKNLKIYNTGLIAHFIYPKKSVDKLKHRLRMILSYISNKIGFFRKRSLFYYEKGYNLFSIQGYAMLYDEYKDHKFFKSRKFKKILSYGTSKDYLNELIKPKINDCGNTKMLHSNKINEYTFLYNSPAFCYSYIYKKFNLDDAFLETLWDVQMRFYSQESKEFGIGFFDKDTLTSRIYEFLKSYSNVY